MSEKKSKILNCFIMFFSCAVIGWLYEMALFFVYQQQPYNRGFLYGPYLPIYGFGALLLLVLPKKLMEKEQLKKRKMLNVIVVFLCILLITTAVELLVSYILDWLHMEPMWDYSSYILNFEGRISLEHSIRFGIGGLIFLFGLKPLLESILQKSNIKAQKIIAIMLLITMIVDLALTIGTSLSQQI